MTEPTDLIIVVDDDLDIARFIQFSLEQEGYRVILAHDGETALALIDRHSPALAIVDWMMPKIDGLELTRMLRANSLHTSMPIIMLTARGQTAEKVVGLTAGADDYLVKPFDTLELVARIHSTLRRNREYREVSPLTGLPGNNRIQREIADRIRAGVDYAVCYMDIDRFKSVNDRYGFARGDEFITALARALNRAAVGCPPPPAFIGHIGGDDFIIVCAPNQVQGLTTQVVGDFEVAADRLYDPEDAARGFIEVRMRSGDVQKAALVTLSIGVAQSFNGWYRDPRDAMSAASGMKTDAKKHKGSWVSLDQRGLPDQYLE